jgi:hypothetical protein
MKISDIKRLIHCPHGETSTDFKWLPDMLEHFKSSYGLDLDPEFQRGHVWDLKKKIKFIEYVLRGGTVPPLRFNSPVFGGHPHAKNSDLDESVVLVDGKQRLSAILEFMDNQFPVFGDVYLKDFDNPMLLCSQCRITYTVNKLQTRKELYQWYLEMNEGQVAHTDEELDKVRVMMENLK